MERVTIGKLRNQLRAYLRKVRAGETVLVLDRDTVIARLEPAAEAESDDARVARLAAKGVLKPAKKPWRSGALAARMQKDLPKSRKSVLQALLEERQEGR